MAQSLPNAPHPTGDDPVQPNEAALTPGFEERLHLFWEKNSRTILIGVALVVLAIVGKGVFEWNSARRERAVQADYAAAVTLDNLKTFAAAHPGHILAGAANLRLADNAYKTGQFAEAVTAYQLAASTLGETVLASRARLGAAVAQLQAGDVAGAEAALQKLADNADELAGVRAEAAYHLAVQAAETNQTAIVNQRIEQIFSVEPSGVWAQRAMMLKAAQPAPAVAAAPAPGETEAPTAVSFPSLRP